MVALLETRRVLELIRPAVRRDDISEILDEIEEAPFEGEIRVILLEGEDSNSLKRRLRSAARSLGRNLAFRDLPEGYEGREIVFRVLFLD